MVWKAYLLSNMAISGTYVSFRGCKDFILNCPISYMNSNLKFATHVMVLFGGGELQKLKFTIPILQGFLVKCLCLVNFTLGKSVFFCRNKYSTNLGW